MDDTQRQEEQTRKRDAIISEMKRVSQDEIKIKNPLNIPYTVYWDGYGHTVSTNEERVFPRYLAMKFMNEIIDLVLTFRSEKYIYEINKKRLEKGFSKLTAEERLQIEISPDFKISDKNLRRPWVKSIWLGVTREYGREEVLPERRNNEVDHRSPDEQIIDELSTTSEGDVTKRQITQSEETVESKPNLIETNLVNMDIDQSKIDTLSTETGHIDRSSQPVTIKDSDLPGKITAPDEVMVDTNTENKKFFKKGHPYYGKKGTKN